MDAIYTDAWTSMGHEHEEQERNKIFPPYQVNETLDGGRGASRRLHALPARAPRQGSHGRGHGLERSVVFDQAENRLHVQKAILLILLGGKVGRTNSRSANA